MFFKTSILGAKKIYIVELAKQDGVIKQSLEQLREASLESHLKNKSFVILHLKTKFLYLLTVLTSIFSFMLYIFYKIHVLTLLIKDYFLRPDQQHFYLQFVKFCYRSNFDLVLIASSFIFEKILQLDCPWTNFNTKKTQFVLWMNLRITSFRHEHLN